MPFWKSSKEKDDVAHANEILSEAFACIDQGLCYDEIGDYDNTISMYERGLNLIAEAEKDKNAKKAELWSTMQEAKKSVENRITALQKMGPKNLAKDGLSPMESGIPAEVEMKRSKEMTEQDKNKDQIRQNLDSAGDQEAELVYFLPSGVQLFTIEGEETAAPTYPTSLEILRFKEDFSITNKEVKERAEAFIQVGPWVYPLMKEKTPILKNEFGAYVLANPTPEHPNMMVAIMLPFDLEPKLVDEFEYVLREYADLRSEEIKDLLTADERSRLSERIARLLVTTGEKIAWGVHSTTAKVTSKVEEKNVQYRSTRMPTDQPVNISPAIKTGVVYMHKGGKVVAKCTRFLLDKIGDMGVAVGKTIASGAKDTFGEGKTGGMVTGTITVIGGGIAGVSTVWIALEDASKNLCKSIANETVENVRLKYGDEAAQTTHHALHATGHTSLAAVQLWDLGPRSVAGRMARKAGLQVLSDLHRKRTGQDVLTGDALRNSQRREKQYIA
ncbi:unnamed protein product, partial [Mesorhabditis belari]|uniref:Inheritance of peroxisomes protein 1 n=1 Tax=Mesorhabditis belari TaxID=2138241 RepID=A0AAF3F1U0_9BILA